MLEKSFSNFIKLSIFLLFIVNLAYIIAKAIRLFLYIHICTCILMHIYVYTYLYCRYILHTAYISKWYRYLIVFEYSIIAIISSMERPHWTSHIFYKAAFGPVCLHPGISSKLLRLLKRLLKVTELETEFVMKRHFVSPWKSITHDFNLDSSLAGLFIF